MKTLALSTFLILTFLIGSGISTTRATTNPTPKKVVIISIDSLRPEFYLSNDFETPTLHYLKSIGSYSQATVSVFPTVTYPNHTSLITGVYPKTHGVLSNTLFNWNDGPLPAWYWEADKIKAPTLYGVALAAGKTTAAVRWPVTVGAEMTYLVPEIFKMDGYYDDGNDFELTMKLTKPELRNELLTILGNSDFKDDAIRDLWASNATVHIIKKYHPDLTLLHVVDVDHQQHQKGRDAEETKAALKSIDQQVKSVVDSVDLNETCIFIVGDHGFFDYTKKVGINKLFLDAGWLKTDKKGKITTWKVVAQTSGGQAAIYAKDPKMAPEVEKLLRDHAEGYAVISKSDLNKLNAYPDAILAVEGLEGYTVSGTISKTLVTEAGKTQGQHGFLPTHPKLKTGFIAAGCGISKDKNLGETRVIDVAPTAANLLGVSLGTVDGEVLNLFQ